MSLLNKINVGSTVNEDSIEFDDTLDNLRAILHDDISAQCKIIDLIMKSGDGRYYFEAESICNRLIVSNEPKGYLYLARMYRRGLIKVKDVNHALDFY